MKAFEITAPENMSIVERDMVKISLDHDVLVQTKAVGICGSDIHIYHGRNKAASYPRIIGHEVAGEVISIGKKVHSLSIHDHVVLDPIEYCGKCYACRTNRNNVCKDLKVRGVHVDGGCQEYFVAEESKLHVIPKHIPWKIAVMIEPYTIGAQVCSRAQVLNDDVVMIYGMGPAGLAILDTAKHLGTRCIVSDIFTMRLDLARSFGADYILNATTDNVRERILEITGDMGPNVIIDAAGVNDEIIKDAIEIASVAGRIVSIAIPPMRVPVNMGLIVFKELALLGSRLQMHKFETVIASLDQYLEHMNMLVTHTIPFSKSPKAIELACKQENVGKVVVIFE
jgi:L-gulonate 5-dehydrogenase